ncbi:hypothetical protein ASPCADRAFT_211072 [Aspergillus carbonarius ITEM 5010]|uniref:adenosine deaminase n=1 Tax=Aspergillus carbonarius (strain ITEM 5010) TaxID=602072 RepID=A0A1R3RB69_ASPC5|nr:hypothetical protein ASPCADRAFT_211072 [Aspergillus carbonarius ITEM 5010]
MVSEDLPKVEDQSIQDYLKKREALIQEEKRQRHDFHLRQSLSPLAQQACNIVSRIRQRELTRVWSKELDDPAAAHEADEILYPGVMFHLAKGRMESTDLWRIVHRMPKGSLLHAHLDAMFDVDFLIDQALATPGMHLSATAPLCSTQTLTEAPILFQYSKSPRTQSEQNPTPWNPAYQPNSLVDITVAAASFPAGGEQGFRTWLRNRCVIAPEHSFQHHHGVDAIWAIFQRVFPVLDSILLYEPIFRAGLRRLLSQLAADGVRYVEFRLGFSTMFRREGHEEAEPDLLIPSQIFQEEVTRFQASEPGRTFYGARIIHSILRRWPDEQIIDSMKKCIAAKQAFPEVISGIDFVGQEDQGRPLVDLIPVLFWFRHQCLQENVNIPFFFHAGECLGDGDATDQNLFDAILLDTRRIGHGFSLFKHPLLIDQVKAKNILIECCPISNEILRLASSIKAHPLPALLARGVPVSLCNDDPAILGHGKNGLTHDFWQSLQGLENLGLEGLAMMVENSIRWSCYEDQSAEDWQAGLRDGVQGGGVKAARLREWDADFEAFCGWIVEEYGDGR